MDSAWRSWSPRCGDGHGAPPWGAAVHGSVDGTTKLLPEHPKPQSYAEPPCEEAQQWDFGQCFSGGCWPHRGSTMMRIGSISGYNRVVGWFIFPWLLG